MKKKALITGITGQDAFYLIKLLVRLNYEVHGIIRRSSNLNRDRLDRLDNYLLSINKKNLLKLHYGDLCDSSSVTKILDLVRPNEIYHLGAQSHVKISFEIPVYTAEATALGTLKLLESVRFLKLKSKIYLAGSSEMYGKVTQKIQNEKTPFYPRSPYGVSKVFSYYAGVNYREAYNMFICNGILFNHESPERGENFVSRKISLGVASIKLGLKKKLILGNLNAKRDWGYAEDYIKGMYAMMQHKQPDDFVLATGKTYSVKDFCKLAFQEVNLDWKKYVEVDKKFFRPSEVDYLIGDPSKAKKILKWEHKLKFSDLVKLMVHSDLKKLQNK
jgi:GDPmannose 4,6-dehydratase